MFVLTSDLHTHGLAAHRVDERLPGLTTVRLIEFGGIDAVQADLGQASIKQDVERIPVAYRDNLNASHFT